MAARQAARSGPATVVLAGGHESDGGRDLAALVGHRPGGAGPAVHAAAAAGRHLVEAVRSALAATGGPVCVVPMTLGRDPRLVADTARALRWLAAGEGRERLALTAPFGAAEHLVGWLRTAAGGATRTGDGTAGRAAAGNAAAGNAAAGNAAAGNAAAGNAAQNGGGTRTGTGSGTRTDGGGAVLITAPAAGPFEDADLFRIARLVRQYGHHRWVEVALTGGDPEPAEGAERCRLLGAAAVTAVPASFGPALRTALPGVRDGGPLLRPSAVAGVVAARTAAALHLLGHGEDGIAAGLDAEHGHGYAHSHGPGDAGSHPHPHNHSHGHLQSHPHGHPHGHPQTHPHGHPRADTPTFTPH
ncbi:cobalamin biosynthesis protein CbiX [Kitasatospora sp. NPDC048194]|uniref:cobalamin biosynthesis protein CbiX n=1 Tax=Kitasatospora sp. NPDC048194 TaxID=3364045 RepID=UPI003722C9FB